MFPAAISGRVLFVSHFLSAIRRWHAVVLPTMNRRSHTISIFSGLKSYAPAMMASMGLLVLQMVFQVGEILCRLPKVDLILIGSMNGIFPHTCTISQLNVGKYTIQIHTVILWDMLTGA